MYVLLITFLLYSKGISTQQITFSTLKACEAAAVQIEKLEGHGEEIKSTCVKVK